MKLLMNNEIRYNIYNQNGTLMCDRVGEGFTLKKINRQ